ncbi:MAG: polysaccharide biosynthesis/export family protein [Rubellimicrobium sp.]|nr:polysaccharide biosynthesis/export family protein [Rubellimicrobium sp.]
MRLVPVPIAALLALALAGCAAFPRGAGLTREVLAAPAEAEAGFAVTPVTGATITRIAAWPLPGPAALSWPAAGAARPQAIAPGDTLALTLWSTEENGLLAAPGARATSLPGLRVSPEGRVFLPYLGEVPVAGLSPDAARARIEERYLAVMPAVQVQFARSGGRAGAASLVSGMARPGSYPLEDGATLLQILAEGGGVATGINNPQIRLQRGGRVYGISFDRLAGDPARDVALQGGDRVLVVPDERVFLSLGAAGRQARHPFPQDRVSALDALAIIGGVAPARADARAILVLRQYPAQALRGGDAAPPEARMVFTIDLTSADGLFSAGAFAIAPGDLVHVSESPLVGARNLLALAGSVFGLRDRIEGD